MSVPAFLERMVWTFIASAGGALLAPAVFGFDVEVWQAALIAGSAAVVNALTQFARYRLSVLPDPGAGLPGLPAPNAPEGDNP
jgi:hypothetical protein